MPRRGGWPLWLAVKSVVTGAGSLGVAVVLNRTLIPKVQFELKGVDLPALSAFVLDHHAWLPVVPVLSLILAIAAVAIRSLRPLLAIVATIVSTLALAVVVAALVLVLTPLYQMQ